MKITILKLESIADILSKQSTLNPSDFNFIHNLFNAKILPSQLNDETTLLEYTYEQLKLAEVLEQYRERANCTNWIQAIKVFLPLTNEAEEAINERFFNNPEIIAMNNVGEIIQSPKYIDYSKEGRWAKIIPITRYIESIVLDCQDWQEGISPRVVNKTLH